MLKKTDLLKTGKLIIFTESKETAVYLAGKIRDEVDSKVLLFTGESLKTVREDVIANFDAKAYRPKDEYRILVATEVLAEGVNLHRSNVVINYDIPWNPTRLIQRVGRVNRVDTKFDKIHTYNFFPTEEGNDLIKLREAAEAKIHAFIQMLGADARLLTEGEEIVSHDLFARWNSKKTITGEDEDEESELKFPRRRTPSSRRRSATAVPWATRTPPAPRPFRCAVSGGPRRNCGWRCGRVPAWPRWSGGRPARRAFHPPATCRCRGAQTGRRDS
ncbi:MAG: SWF/SNF helicase family protein [Verrucomicrobia bacterium]|nr:SWF/SNF helicase family protein [Verrucomicrobiota bacterium]